MNPNPKSNKDAADRPEDWEITPAAAFATLFHKGMVRFAEVQKSAFDMFAGQSADLHNAWKHTHKLPAATPAMFFMDWAAEGVEKLVDAQKSLLDLAVGQSTLAVNGAKERTDSASRFAATLNDMIQQSTDRLVAAEKVVLDFAARQNAALTDRCKRQFGFAEATLAAAAADSVRRGVDAVLETQKELLDIAAKPLKAATAVGD